MRVIKSPKEMQAFSDELRAKGKKIAFVPTMGYFHEGHLSLMRIGKEMADHLVISIFVNPTQFAPGEDLEQYPRDWDRDVEMAESVGVDTIYNPDASHMYPEGYETYIRVTQTEKPLCGISRPIFFQGVATVCNKLFNAVKPHFAVFGEKDYQQFLVVSKMVRDLNMDLEIIPGALVREPDGLAMSSRNVYLSDEERSQATVLYKSLKEAEKLVDDGERDAGKILEKVKEIIGSSPLAKIDYAELRRIPGLNEVKEKIEGETLLALAVFYGKTRLIDNIVLFRHV